MDFGRAFTYITEDDDWIQKIGIAVVLLLFSPVLGITAIPLVGWVMETVRRVSNVEENPLPEWENFGDYFMTGLKAIGVTIVWSLPAILIAGCGSAAIVLMGNQFASADDAAAAVSIVTICLSLLVLVYALVLTFLMGPMTGMLADGADWKELLNPAKAFNLFKANIGGYLIAMIGGQFLISILASVGVILCGIGSLIGAAYGYAVFAHLLGQAHLEAKANTTLIEVPATE
jgi:hypothetical protein